MYLVSPCISLLRFGQTSNSNVKVKYVNIMRNFFSVVIPPHILRFTSSTDHYVSNQGADVLSTAGLLCTAGLLVTGRPARNAAMPVLFLLSGPKIGFCPPQGIGPSVRSPCQISHLSGQKCGNTAPKTVKISNFGNKFARQRSLICTIFMKFSDFVRIYRWILSL